MLTRHASTIFASLLLLAPGCDSGSDDGGAEDESGSSTQADDGSTGGTSCPTGLTNCDGECVDLANDAANCGSCGFSCEAGASCVNASCMADCEAPLIPCGGTCIDASNDDENCGACGQACAPGLSCESSSCACGDPVVFSTDVVPLLTDSCNGNNCHSAMDAKAGLDLSGEVYSVLVDVPSQQCNSGVLVSPGNVEGSYLMNKMLGEGMCQGQRMPRNDPAYSDEQLSVLANWICHGAAND